MREVVLTLPNETAAQRAAVARLEAVLLVDFGGFTEQDGIGQWQDSAGHPYVEKVKRFAVATDPARAQVAINDLRQVARAAREQAIYYVDASGEARIEALAGEVAA